MTALTSFVALPTRALGDRNLTAVHLVVLGAICRAVNAETGEAIISGARIAEMTNRPRRKVTSAIGDLEAFGYILPINRGRQAHTSTPGRFLTNLYRIHYDGEVVEQPTTRSRGTPGVSRNKDGNQTAPWDPVGDTARGTPLVRSRGTPLVTDSDLHDSDLVESVRPLGGADAPSATSSLPAPPAHSFDHEDDALGAFSQMFDDIYSRGQRPRLVTIEGKVARQGTEQVVEPEDTPEEKARIEAWLAEQAEKRRIQDEAKQKRDAEAAAERERAYAEHKAKQDADKLRREQKAVVRTALMGMVDRTELDKLAPMLPSDDCARLYAMQTNGDWTPEGRTELSALLAKMRKARESFGRIASARAG